MSSVVLVAEASITSVPAFLITIFDTFELVQESDIPIPGLCSVPISARGLEEA